MQNTGNPVNKSQHAEPAGSKNNSKQHFIFNWLNYNLRLSIWIGRITVKKRERDELEIPIQKEIQIHIDRVGDRGIEKERKRAREREKA